MGRNKKHNIISDKDIVKLWRLLFLNNSIDKEGIAFIKRFGFRTAKSIKAGFITITKVPSPGIFDDVSDDYKDLVEDILNEDITNADLRITT